MIFRGSYLDMIHKALDRNPVAMLLGPRQVGKSTLARELLPPDSPNYFDLDLPAVSFLLEQPLTALQHLKGLVVIDEAQRAPQIFPVLRVLADRPNNPAKFLLLGSASPELSRQSNESLAGRVEMIDVQGFSLNEVGREKADQLWLRGGFPRSFTATDDEASMAWRGNFTRTFVERDLGLLGFGFAPAAMSRFWTLLAHFHGQVWNASEAAAVLGVTPRTANRYLDALEQTYMVRRLQPWHANVGKRIVKSPKLYLRDTGILHWQLRLGSLRDLLLHPKMGASWEGFAMEQVLGDFPGVDPYFYGIHSGSELDLFFLHHGKRIGVEFKRMDAPRPTRSMHIALEDLQLDQLWLVYPGTRRYALGDKVECVPLGEIGGPHA